LAGVDQLQSLSTLRVFGPRRLLDLRPIGETNHTLEELELESCPGVGSITEIEHLGKLRFLALNDCDEINSLAPLTPLTHRKRLHAWGTTRISDGDLSPLADLPNLSEIRMRDRRGYKPRLADLTLQRRSPS
jgi:hypothetical protein